MPFSLTCYIAPRGRRRGDMPSALERRAAAEKAQRLHAEHGHAADTGPRRERRRAIKMAPAHFGAMAPYGR